ncbi:hypothetical protein FOZ61_002490 [Perkinsus olseni]|uniref:Kinesin motor domain-containing protein n=1 Tax=Perkinsus olseni TaxID=32597 RepID=A0A7J6MFI7_PEROL|nr:hypothetical protein FOZ61_002490 [Perkinsus olseni]
MTMLVIFLLASILAVPVEAIRGNPMALRVGDTAGSVPGNARANVLKAQTEEAMKGYEQTVNGILAQYGGGLPPASGGSVAVPQQVALGAPIRQGGFPDSWAVCAVLLGIIVAGVLWYLQQQQQKQERRKTTRRLIRPVMRKRLTLRDKVRSYCDGKESTCGSVGSSASSVSSARVEPGSPRRVQLPVTVVSPEDAIEAIDRKIQAAFTPYRNKVSASTSAGSTVSARFCNQSNWPLIRILLSSTASQASSSSSASSVKRLHPIFMMKAAAAGANPTAEGGSNTTLSGVATPRRSVEKCVVEVARLKREREARRRESAEKRLERDQEEESLKAAGYASCDVQFERMIREFRASSVGNSSWMSPRLNTDRRIQVVVRKRPLFGYEKKPSGGKTGQLDIVSIANPRVLVHECKVKVDGITKFLENHEFAFDRAYSERSGTGEVFRTCVEGPTREVLREGGRFTVFAYGQTGSGKTYTMVGMEARLITSIFGNGRDRRSVYVSFFEIYGGRAYDLLNRRSRLKVLEDASQEVQIPKLIVRRAITVDQLSSILYAGNSARTTFATTSNKDSSRSHAVCVISTSSERGPEARITLVDLAGSERAHDSQSHRLERRIEGAEINKSLLALKECVRAVDSGRAHIPFRASKLTMVLRDAFLHEGARMVMIACIKPGQHSGDHTLNTLRYAARLKRSSAGSGFDDMTPRQGSTADGVESLEKVFLSGVVQKTPPSRSPSPREQLPATPRLTDVRPTESSHRRTSLRSPSFGRHSPSLVKSLAGALARRDRAIGLHVVVPELESLPETEPLAPLDDASNEETSEDPAVPAGRAAPLTLDQVKEEHLKAIQGDAALLAAETELLAKMKGEQVPDLEAYVREARQIWMCGDVCSVFSWFIVNIQEMPSVLVAVANDSEEIEFNATVDVLARGGCQVTVACPGHDRNVKLSRGVRVVADMTLEQASDMQFDMIACPGGMPGAKHLGNDAFLATMLRTQHTEGKWVAAICASPAVVLAPNGILDDVSAHAVPSLVQHCGLYRLISVLAMTLPLSVKSSPRSSAQSA